MDNLFKKLKFQNLDDWYNISAKDLIHNGAATLLSIYQQSPSKLFISIYPEHNWKPWKFGNVPKVSKNVT